MRNLIVLIPMVVVGIIFWRYQKRNGTSFGPISWIMAVYLVMTVLAVVLDVLGQAMAAYELRVAPALYLSACLAIAFWGLTSLTDRQVREIEIENIPIYRLFEIFLIVSSFISIAFFFPFARNALVGDIGSNRNDFEYFQGVLSAWGLLNTFSSLAANLFVFNLIFAFLNLAPGFGSGKASRVRAILLFGGSTSEIFYVLAYVGRDGFVFWAATFILVYLLLRKFISDRSRRAVRKFAWIVLGLALVPFVAITVSRFGSSDAGILLSVLQYGGVQVQQFNDQFIGYSEPQWGRLNFPILFRLLPFDDPYFDRSEWFAVYTELGVNPWTFSTYIGSFVQDVGIWATPVLVGLIALGTRSSLRGVRLNGRLSLAQMFVFVLGAQIVLYGVFYFRQSMANSSVVAVLLIVLLFKVSGRLGKRRVLTSVPNSA